MVRKCLLLVLLAAVLGPTGGCMNRCDRPSLMDRLRARFGRADCCEACPCDCGPTCCEAPCCDGPMLPAPPINGVAPPIVPGPIPGPGPLTPQATVPPLSQPPLRPVPQSQPMPYTPGTTSNVLR